LWVGLGWVQKFWVGLGFEKMTHDQLCVGLYIMRMDLLVGRCMHFIFCRRARDYYAFFMHVRAQMHVVSYVLCSVRAVFCYNLLVHEHADHWATLS